MHWSIREILHKTGIHQLTVHRIIHRDLQLKSVKRRRGVAAVVRRSCRGHVWSHRVAPSDSLLTATEEGIVTRQSISFMVYTWKTVVPVSQLTPQRRSAQKGKFDIPRISDNVKTLSSLIGPRLLRINGTLIRASDWYQNQGPWIILKGHYALCF